MDVKETLEKIKKALFGGEDYTSYTLQDGTSVTISALSEGGEVYVNGEPAPDGEHILSDGSKITTVSGKITVYTPVTTDVEIDTEMALYKLQDGTEVGISTLVEGGNLIVAGVPATEGEYTLEDGTKLTVDANGVILKVEVAGVEVDAPMQMSKEDFAAVVSEKVDAVKADFNTQIEAQNKTIADQKEVIKQLFEIVEKLGGEPSDNPPAPRKKVQSFGMTSDMRDSKIGKYAEAAKQAFNN